MILSSRARGTARTSLVTAMLASPLYPVALQVAFGVAFVLILVQAFVGPAMGENNLAVVATWQLWWLLLPFSFLVLGRMWCTVCPIGAVNDLALKIPGLPRRIPGTLLRKSAPWTMGALFLALFWIGVVKHICCWPKATAAVLLAFAGGAGLAGLFYQGRAWCRYFCPVGMFSALLSLGSFVGLRSERTTCRETCRSDKRRVLVNEMKGCPLYQLPMAVDSNRNCNLCGNCVKYCAHGSISLKRLRPDREMSRIKHPIPGEALFVIGLIAIAFVEAVQATQAMPRYMKWAMAASGIENYDAVFSVTIFAVAVLALGAYITATRLSAWSGRDAAPWSLASFGYGFIPLALAATLGIAVFRLASEGGRAIKVAVNEIALFDVFDLPPPVRGTAYTVVPAVKALQLSLLAAGTFVALYVIYRIASRRAQSGALARALPPMALVLAFSATFLLTFLQPADMILH